MNWKISLSERLLKSMWLSARSQIEATVTPGMGGVGLLGDSITHMGRWELLFPTIPTRNFGISGERTDHLLARLDPIVKCRPDKLFILIGTNDLGLGVSVEKTAANVNLLLTRLSEHLPPASLYLQAVMPRARKYAARVKALNAHYRRIAETHGANYVDLYSIFDDGSGEIIADYTFDKLHLNGPGYLVWRDKIGPLMLRA